MIGDFNVIISNEEKKEGEATYWKIALPSLKRVIAKKNMELGKGLED